MFVHLAIMGWGYIGLWVRVRVRVRVRVIMWERLLISIDPNAKPDSVLEIAAVC